MSKHHHLSLNDATPEDWDRVSRPKHYSSQNPKFPDLECIDSIQASMSSEGFKGYLKGCVLKYMWRYEDKDEPKQDLEKAQECLRRLLQEISNG